MLIRLKICWKFWGLLSIAWGVCIRSLVASASAVLSWISKAYWCFVVAFHGEKLGDEFVSLIQGLNWVPWLLIWDFFIAFCPAFYCILLRERLCLCRGGVRCDSLFSRHKRSSWFPSILMGSGLWMDLNLIGSYIGVASWILIRPWIGFSGFWFNWACVLIGRSFWLDL